MYIKKKLKKNSPDVNLAPLIDVLTCTVGIMLFVVIFAVIAAKGASIRYLTPLQSDVSPEGKSRNLFICKKGKIKFFNIDMAVDSLFSVPKVTFANVPRLVANANKKNVHDSYFRYSYSYKDYTQSSWFSYYTVRVISITVNELDSLGGDNSDQLKNASSNIAKHISSLNADSTWIAFALEDEESLEVFNEARNRASGRDIVNGWDPLKIKFPLTIPLVNSESDSDTFCPFCPQNLKF